MNYRYAALALAVLVSWLALALAPAGDEPAAERPPEVPAGQWIALSDSVGIVLTDGLPTSGGRGSWPGDRTAAVSAVVVARLDGVWVRVELEPAAMGVVPIR